MWQARISLCFHESSVCVVVQWLWWSSRFNKLVASCLELCLHVFFLCLFTGVSTSSFLSLCVCRVRDCWAVQGRLTSCPVETVINSTFLVNSNHISGRACIYQRWWWKQRHEIVWGYIVVQKTNLKERPEDMITQKVRKPKAPKVTQLAGLVFCITCISLCLQTEQHESKHYKKHHLLYKYLIFIFYDVWWYYVV